MRSGRGEECVLFTRGCVRAWCIFEWCVVVVQLGGKAGLSTGSVGVVAGVAGCSSPAASGWQGCGSLGGRVREV